MKATVYISMLLALLGAGSIDAQKRHGGPLAIDELKIAFAGRGAEAAGILDFGSVTHTGEGALRGRTVRQETVAVTVTRRSGIRGMVTLRAWLAAPDPRCVVRVDGVALTTLPVIVDPQVAIGSESMHRIEVEVPVSAAEGALDTRIEWEATSR